MKKKYAHSRRDSFLGESGRYAKDRAHRPAKYRAHGDHGRGGDDAKLCDFMEERKERRQTVLSLVEFHADAYLDSAEGRESG